MTNLRDWQKKTSFWTPDYACEIKEMDHGIEVVRAEYVDLLIQIIEKQSQAIAWYERSTVGALHNKARTTQAEVQGLVEKLTGEK